ncbi:probable cytochrome P450 4s3 [Stomoxys calcitrans]|uniref:Cytochrome P450 n=1 Tax=Stomoxys calcitrans TaxID=35570 RepID=A0A1I8PPH1_STOCA|nr:probable cytochrome P450 4s3 [Stomoxys calcitrans]
MDTLIVITFALGVLFMRYLSKIKELVKLKQWSAMVPGPTTRELMANAKEGSILKWLYELRKKHGPIFRIWFGKDMTVFFSDPEDIKQLLTSNSLLYKANNYNAVVPWLGYGLLTSGGELWQARRKFLTPAFHFRILSEFKEPMEENCKILATRLMKEAQRGEEFDVYPYITLFALDVICETAMGLKKHAQMQNESEYVKAVNKTCHLFHKRSFSLWQRLNIFYKYTKDGRERDAALKIMHDETNRVIKLRRKLLQDSQILSMQDAEKTFDSDGKKKRLAFLDMLLISQMEGIPLTDQEIREEVDTFMFAGHDTTSSTISFAIYLLSQHAEIQKRTYEEAVALEGKEKESMPYLEAIIKETLRLYPASAFFSRGVKEDLAVGSLTLPKGANVTVLTYAVHRDERYFPQPEQFRPERFMENGKELHPFCFVPFSAGPRNCIGQKYAMLEMKCVLSSLLRKFEFLPVKGFQPQPVPEIVLKSKNGIKIRIKQRC